MSLFADVKASFHAIRTALHQQRRLALDLADRLQRSAPRLTEVIAASTHPAARKTLSDLTATIEHLHAAARLAAQSENAIAEYVAIITGTPPTTVPRRPDGRSANPTAEGSDRGDPSPRRA